MAQCIWCLNNDAPAAVEHIIPEALGCPDGFILSKGEVCRACNNGLAHLDQAVIDDFDLLTYINNVPRKKGRPPEIRNRGNMVGTKGSTGKIVSINMNRYPAEAHDGSKLGALGKSDRNIGASFKRDGELGEVSFSVQIGQNPKFRRGIVKIALSSLSYFLGNEAAAASGFDPVRTFVRNGKGDRRLLLMVTNDTGFRNQAWPPFQSATGEYAVTFRLAIYEFCVDLSPNMTLFPMLKKKAAETFGSSGWTFLPTDS